MSGSGKSAGPGITPEAMLDALRGQGAERFDPVRFRYLEALARRAATQPGEVRRLLEGKLATLLIDYRERREQACKQASQSLARSAERFPAAAEDLQQSHAAGDFSGLARLVASLEAQGRCGPLAELLAHIGQLSPEAPEGSAANAKPAAVEPAGELKSVAYFRSTWSQLSVDQQLAQSLAQAPENAGPLNSHRLALQALTQMRDISPAYLKRFMSYVDALFWLDQAEAGRNAGQKTAGDGEKKRKSARRSAG